jgi:hypothetical protein
VSTAYVNRYQCAARLGVAQVWLVQIQVLNFKNIIYLQYDVCFQFYFHRCILHAKINKTRSHSQIMLYEYQWFQVIRLVDRARGLTRWLITIRVTTRTIRNDDLDHSPGGASMESNRWLGGGIGNPSAQCEARALLLVVCRANQTINHTNCSISQTPGWLDVLIGSPPLIELMKPTCTISRD